MSSAVFKTEPGQPLPFASQSFTPFRRKGLTPDFIQIIIHLYVRKRVVTLKQKLLVNSNCPSTLVRI